MNKTIAGWRSDDKKRPIFFAKPIFMNENSDNQWSLQIPVPKMTLILSNLLDKLNVTHQFISGPVTAIQPGFCALNRDDGNDTFGELPLTNLTALG